MLLFFCSAKQDREPVSSPCFIFCFAHYYCTIYVRLLLPLKSPLVSTRAACKSAAQPPPLSLSARLEEFFRAVLYCKLFPTPSSSSSSVSKVGRLAPPSPPFSRMFTSLTSPLPLFPPNVAWKKSTHLNEKPSPPSPFSATVIFCLALFPSSLPCSTFSTPKTRRRFSFEEDEKENIQCIK